MANNILQSVERAEAGINHPKFGSLAEFLSDLSAVIKLALKMRKELSRLNRMFRETICLTVTYANNCKL